MIDKRMRLENMWERYGFISSQKLEGLTTFPHCSVMTTLQCSLARP